MLKELRGGNNFIEMLQREAREIFDRVNQQYFNGKLRQKYKVVFSKQMKITQGIDLPQKKIILIKISKNLGKVTSWHYFKLSKSRFLNHLQPYYD